MEIFYFCSEDLILYATTDYQTFFFRDEITKLTILKSDNQDFEKDLKAFQRPLSKVCIEQSAYDENVSKYQNRMS